MRKILVMMVSALTLALVLAACGDATATSTPATTAAATTAVSTTAAATTSSTTAAATTSSATTSTSTTSAVTTSAVTTSSATSAAATTAAATTARATTAPAGSTTAATTASATTALASGNLTKITVVLGFVPSVGFAGFYMAQDKGYYASEGLDVTFQYGSVDNLVQQLSDGKIEFALLSGDQVVPARAQGLGVTYVMGIYEKSPVGLVAIQGNGAPIKDPADLKGRTIGVSALSGTTYIGLKALLQAGKLTDDDVKVVAVGFTEVEAMTTKRVDAAMTFLPNESVQMAAMNIKTDALTVSDYVKIVPSGLATGDKTIKDKPNLVQHFINATSHGMRDTLASPEDALTSTLKRIQELTQDQIPTQRQVLAATLAYMQPIAGHPQGWSDPADWKTTVDFLTSIKLTDTSIDPATAYTNKFVEAVKP